MEYFKGNTLKSPMVSPWTKEYIWSLKRRQYIICKTETPWNPQLQPDLSAEPQIQKIKCQLANITFTLSLLKVALSVHLTKPEAL